MGRKMEKTSTKTRRIAGALVIAAIQSPVPFVSSTAERISTLVIDAKVVISGTCSDFGTPQTNLHSCDSQMFYEHYSNGRAAFVVQKTFSKSDEENDPTGEYQAGRRQRAVFSGGRDQQTHAEDYYLFVDHVSTSLHDSNGLLGANEVPASGSCHLTGDALMTHVSRVTCSATYGAAGKKGP